jgi:tetratricopeptide (TPR) repeat protein
MVGRDDVTSELKRFLFTPMSQGKAVLIISGEEGIGKSFLLRTTIKEARERGIMVLEGRPQAVELPQPFYLLHEILNSLVTQRGREAGSQEGLKSLVTLGFARPGARDRGALPMGLLPFGASLESPEEREARLLAALSGRETDIEEEEQELFDKLADHLDDVAADRKLLLAIDDLQYADQASMDFLGYLSRRSRGKNVRVLATCRPEGETPERVSSVLTDIGHEGLLQRIEVRRLTEEESMVLITQLARGHEVAPATAREWYTLSRGNPLAIEQLYRGGTAAAEATKEGMTRTSATLSKLNDEEKRVLTHAAVIGKTFRFHALFRAVGGDEEKLTEMVDSLIRKGTVKEKGNETYEFTSDDLWREVYSAMTERRRRILHRKAAEALEAEKAGGVELAYDLARHYYLAREYQRAFTYNKSAAELAMKSMDNEAATVYLDQALQSLRSIPNRDRAEEEAVVLDYALCLDAAGDVDKAIKLLNEVVTPGRLTLHLAIFFSHAGRWKEAEKLVKDTLDSIGETGDPAMLGIGHRLLGGMAGYRGQFAEAAAHLEKAIPLLQKANMNADAARAKLLLADHKKSLPNAKIEEIDGDYKSGLFELKSLNQPTLLAPAMMNYGLWYIEMGRLDQAMDILEESLTIAEKARNARLIGWTLFNMADLSLIKNDLKRAEELNARSKERLDKVGDKLGLIQVHLIAARLMERKGAHAEAEVEILEAFRLAQEVGFEPDKMEVLFRQGEFYLQRGDKEGAKKRLQELELNNFTKLRPDLEGDFKRFREALQ